MSLAKPGDPLVIGTGKIVAPIRVEDSQPDTIYEERRTLMPRFMGFVPVKERTLDQLPEPEAKDQLALCAIVGARLLGLSEIDIADMFGVSLDAIQEQMKKPSTQATFERMFVALVNANADNVQGRIASYANNAITTVVTLMEGVKTRDDVRLKAAQDILDRSGANAEQFFNSDNTAGQRDDELRITVMDETGEKETIKVEIGRRK